MIAWLCLAGVSAQAAHTQVTLILGADAAKAGDTVLAGVRLKMAAGWHTYWKNPGASGMPTKIEWELPTGVKAGTVRWPVPQKLADDDLTTYIYTNETMLIVPLTLAADLPPGPLALKAKVSWLECEVQCVPGKGTIEATLAVGTETKPSPDLELIQTWEKNLPQEGVDIGAQAWWEKAAETNSRAFMLEWKSTTDASEADFFPDANEKFEVQAATVRVPADAGKIIIRKEIKKIEGDWPKRISGLIIQQSAGQRIAYDVEVALTETKNVGSASTDPTAINSKNSTAPVAQSISIGTILLYAFLGGLILNVMPCVLPVIALKILGFVNQAKENPRQVRKLGLIYTLGVLVSFCGLAGIVIALKVAGKGVGWGFQFNNPYFLVAMTILVSLIALNLFGVFEVTAGSSTLTTASTLSSRHGASGAFFNGLLTTILATSCSAPILAAAVGVAFSLSPLVVLVAMFFVGLGLAAPYLILSWNPAWLKFLPKPGLWMEKFKIAMGFPMLGAAVWLCSLLTIHYGERAWWMAVFLVFLAVAAWVYGEFVQRGRRARWLGLVISLALLITGYGYALQTELRWNDPLTETPKSDIDPEAPKGLAWKPWSTDAVLQAQAQGLPVIVDFTAKWCPTCNTIVKPTLESASVQKKLREMKAVLLLGNYTRQPSEMTAELQRFNRAGVPLVLVYSRTPGLPPSVFDLITPGTILEALDHASK